MKTSNLKSIHLGILLFVSSFLACSPKVWRAADFDSARAEEHGSAYFGKIVPEVRFGKKPTCRVELSAFEENAKNEQYELPPDGMVYFWGRTGEISIKALNCYRNKNWMPKVVFADKVPVFKNGGRGKITYFGTLKVKVRDEDELPAHKVRPNLTEYKVVDEGEEAIRLLQENFPDSTNLTVQKALIDTVVLE